jgi:hypothetical protein
MGGEDAVDAEFQGDPPGVLRDIARLAAAS